MTIKPFARLFETDRFGQILVTFSINDLDEPEITFSFTPKNLGICSATIGFDDTEDGLMTAEALFEKFSTLETVLDFIQPTITRMNQDFSIPKLELENR